MKLQHIAQVPHGSPVGTPCRRLCDRKKSKVKRYHWDRPICPACVTAMARIVDHQPRYHYTWTSVSMGNTTTLRFKGFEEWPS